MGNEKKIPRQCCDITNCDPHSKSDFVWVPKCNTTNGKTLYDGYKYENQIWTETHKKLKMPPNSFPSCTGIIPRRETCLPETHWGEQRIDNEL